MIAVILAGGRGTRLAEETGTRPKPLVEVGGHPIIWHIMSGYAHHGITEFIVCLGYKGYLLKEYFSNLALYESDVTIDLSTQSTTYHGAHALPWRVTLVDTGVPTLTGGRVKRVGPYLRDETFCLTYGDGVGDIDIAASIAFHRRHGRLATVTTVRPLPRFGTLTLDDDRVTSFDEKVADDIPTTNGGFFVLEPGVLEYIDGDETAWEGEPLQRLAEAGELGAYHHHGFWQPMDTLWERDYLDSLWNSGKAPWKVWA